MLVQKSRKKIVFLISLSLLICATNYERSDFSTNRAFRVKTGRWRREFKSHRPTIFLGHPPQMTLPSGRAGCRQEASTQSAPGSRCAFQERALLLGGHAASL